MSIWKKIFNQESFESALEDLARSSLPGAILFSGKECSGKFSAALEIARRLSCAESGRIDCACRNCVQMRELKSENVLALGPRPCLLSIKAFEKRFLQNPGDEESRILFLRSVRSLSIRFSPLLWQGSDKLSKFAPLLSEIEDSLDSIPKDAKKAASDAVKSCEKLEDFLYDSVPIDQIRNAVEWARVRPKIAKKVVILENAERMQEGARNALLKILEEPPSDTVFVLTTSNRGAMMQTILSRVRTYYFRERTEIEEKEILREVFREESQKSVASLLNSFLPFSSSEIQKAAQDYWNQIISGIIPKADAIAKSCAQFSPRILLKEFLICISQCAADFSDSKNSEICFLVLDSCKECWSSVSIYNQSPISAIERLTRKLFLSLRLSR